MLLHLNYVLQVVQVTALDTLLIPAEVVQLDYYVTLASWTTLQFKPPPNTPSNPC